MIQHRSSQKTPLQQRRPEFCLFFWRKPGGATETMARFCSLSPVPKGRREMTSAGAQTLIDSIRASVRREVLQRRAILIYGSMRRTGLETFANTAKVRMKKSSVWTLIASRWLCYPPPVAAAGNASSVFVSPPVTLAAADAPPGSGLSSDAPLLDISRSSVNKGARVRCGYTGTERTLGCPLSLG